MQRKILIIHGWMHNAKIYEKLKTKLEDDYKFNVETYELAGFGNKSAIYYDDIINSYTKDLTEYIKNSKFDVVIAHSLGGNVALRTINEGIEIPILILLSPEYYGVKVLNLAKPLFAIAPSVIKWLKNINPITTFFIKIMSLFTINSWNCITDDVVEAAREADPNVSTNLMKEMCDDKWETNSIAKKVYLITGEKDRIISKKKMKKLSIDLSNCEHIELKNIGHTAVLEDFNSLYKNIEKILCEDK